MPEILSRIDTKSDAFSTCREHHIGLVNELRAYENVGRQAENKAKDKFAARQQLLPRERLALLLDEGGEFLELSSLAGLHTFGDKHGEGSGGGYITGIGQVAGTPVLVMCNNSAIKGGTISPYGLKKALRAQEIALENKLPVISLVESGGANLQYQSEVFVEGGRFFANQARLSAAGNVQLTIVHGSSTAGGAYMPGLSDYVIVVREKAKMFLAGPPLLKAATGEVATDEELGGAKMHAEQAGTAEYIVNDDAEALSLAREVMAHIKPEKASSTIRAYDPPNYPSDELLGIVPIDARIPYDVREIIARIVDGSVFLDFKQKYDQYLVCGHAHIKGQAVGIVANNGPITVKGSTKAAQFIQLCCQSNLPIIYLQNTTGFMVGKQAEQNGIIKHGSKMLQAVANAPVPQITLVVGSSYGAGNYGMCGRGLGPRFIFAWPNCRVAVMGAEQAARVMTVVTKSKLQNKGVDINEADLNAAEAATIERMENESSPWFSTARLWDDGLIDPRDSRDVLATALEISVSGERRQLSKTSFGVARF